MKAYCPKCNEELHPAYTGIYAGEWTTAVGYLSPPGHNHDDNCRTMMYVCKNGHGIKLSVRNRCSAPGCGWMGKERCWCHQLDKFNEWPE